MPSPPTQAKPRFYFDSRLIDPSPLQASELETAPLPTIPPARVTMPPGGRALHTGKRVSLPVERANEQPPVPVEFYNEFTAEFAASFLELIRDGETLHSISLMPGYPSRAYLRRWIRDDKVFEIQYLVACRDRADARADAIDELSRKMMSGELQPDIGREVAKNHRWLASKENTHRYGEKLDTAIRHTVTVAPTRKAIDWTAYEDATTIDSKPDDDA